MITFASVIMFNQNVKGNFIFLKKIVYSLLYFINIVVVYIQYIKNILLIHTPITALSTLPELHH